MKKTATIIVSLLCCGTAPAQTTYTLEQILDSARQNNIAIRSGSRNIAVAAEQRKEAFTKFFPTISGNVAWFSTNRSIVSTDVKPSEMIPASTAAALAQALPAEALAALSNPISINMIKNGVIGGVAAVQPVFAGGRIVNSNRLAKVGEEASRLQLRLSENEVDKTAEQYYWQMASIEEKLKTVAAVEALLGDIHKDVDVAVRAGVAMRNDLLQVQLRQNEIESQKLKLNNGLSLVRMLLAQYCGLRDTTFALSYNMNAGSPLSMKQDHRQALAGTAEYQLLGKQVESAALQKKLAVGENLPSLGVGAGYGYNNILDKSQTRAMVFATLSVPISDWWGGSHAIKRSKIEYQKAVDEKEDKAELLCIRMQNAWNNVEEAYKQLGIAQRSIEQSEENLRLNRDYYKAGTTKMSDLLEAQTLYQQSLDRRTDAFADYQNSILAYKQSVGQ